MTERFMIDDAGTLIDMQTRDMFDIVEEVCPLLNELHEDLETHKQYCKTLGIGITKIMQSIKDDKEDKALMMCLTLLKKLEEEELIE